jgi:RNA polymerase sigma-70 factor (ECF subfamily)
MSEMMPLEAIEELYKTRFSDFVRTAAAITNSIEDGRDAVHDAFVSAVRESGSYRGDGTVEAWLWRIVVTSALAHRREQRKRAELAEPSDAVWTDRSSDEFGQVKARIAALPERQRLVLFLRYYADLDYRAIADALGIRTGSVGAELHAAHRSIRRHLEEVALGGVEK